MQSDVWIVDGEIEIEVEVDQAIADHEGNLRETIKALLVANARLEVARDKAIGMLSSGFVRGRFDVFHEADQK